MGDEPVMIARRTNCPVAASPDRYAAANGLVQHKQCDIIISDDGLQHYALARDIEIVVVDGIRRFGNQRCLPAGPLRESLSKLKSVDLRVEVDNRNEKVGFKIRTAETSKVPYMLIVGKDEVESQTVAVRVHRKGAQETSSVDDFITRISNEISSAIG